MSQSISLSRLARLVGLPRSTLQQMAEAGELVMSDGHIELAEVLRAFPDIEFEDDSELRRVAEIKDAALNKSPAINELPDAGVLMGRLEELSRDYARAEARQRHYAMVLGWLGDKLRELMQRGVIARRTGDDLLQWLKRELDQTPDDNERWQRLVKRERLMRVMSAQITVLPRGLVFEAQGRETILEAGLRSGLSFAYGCSNGNCGECKARILEGEVVKIRPHDYVLSASEKANGVTLTCCYAAVGDLKIEAALATAGEIPQQSLVARVRAIEPLGAGVIGLNLLTARSERLRYVAGQRLRVSVGGHTAELSVASCPCEERRIELHVSRSHDSAFAAHISGLGTNEEVLLTGPFGEFGLDDASTRPIVLIAEGIGYAPIKSVLQHALSLDRAPAIVLVWLADGNGHYQENLPRSYASALDNFRYIPLSAHLSRSAAIQQIAALPKIAESDVYAAASPELLDLLRKALIQSGLPAENFRAETAPTTARVGGQDR